MYIQKSFKQEQEVGSLYIVGTPIGNLEDLSPRAQEILTQVQCIAAEDTRQTRKLLAKFSFSTPLISYHEHNQQSRGEELIERLLAGESIALVSDAGMPAISDPGEDLVQKAVRSHIPVIPIPGPNAALSALVASGIQTQPFLFLGFLPRSSKARKCELAKWAKLPATLLCYEAPHRLVSMLEDVYEICGDRIVAISREMTKKHEEWLRGLLSDCLAYIKESGTKGEYTIVISGVDSIQEEEEKVLWWDQLSILDHVKYYIDQGKTKKEAIQLTAKERGLPKREVYNLYHTK
ncbi:16S rRNA (cytidine(1402)-2'-O)-methyltransferase [Thermoflavimicrobium daqui]|uniref:Ribosomal RNA small subunit methyltransferase I n=1 Tax=Thermoflavimicrobium daqui TaxID=2137476 RepID=A0A364K315_9BACL|nr:16S rRNA (cytidine(1402)-2'-O)-methyltransferase [Thermoflavimicrobium daqui]RAL23158.1 16S rRNA (cytidine(1402)-2'-O)-methyltransferase [Thermoflavimicrobium daqui]